MKLARPSTAPLQASSSSRTANKILEAAFSSSELKNASSEREFYFPRPSTTETLGVNNNNNDEVGGEKNTPLLGIAPARMSPRPSSARPGSARPGSARPDSGSQNPQLFNYPPPRSNNQQSGGGPPLARPTTAPAARRKDPLPKEATRGGGGGSRPGSKDQRQKGSESRFDAANRPQSASLGKLNVAGTGTNIRILIEVVHTPEWIYQLKYTIT
jgi:hypothetical protein